MIDGWEGGEDNKMVETGCVSCVMYAPKSTIVKLRCGECQAPPVTVARAAERGEVSAYQDEGRRLGDLRLNNLGLEKNRNTDERKLEFEHAILPETTRK
jgi:hypothetical protein